MPEFGCAQNTRARAKLDWKILRAKSAVRPKMESRVPASGTAGVCSHPLVGANFWVSR
jgi:hypothetical protein